ncbi:MAG: DUF1343 domain-containing protein [Alphaproteobacteria bacterium]|nr:DUF1343 domain-containing protein [Alphaproteobacteria bacterium]
MNIFFKILFCCIIIGFGSKSQAQAVGTVKAKIVVGAACFKDYLPLLMGKKIGLLVNQTSEINGVHLVDTLKALGINITIIFGPEHGFRNNASNGEAVKDEVDTKTQIPIISLYGKHKKPSPDQVVLFDVFVFDIQDVGCRFYTYINTLRDIMEVCAEYKKPLIVLDRPNPNAYIDGPILEKEFYSGIGQFPIPITYGLTIGEFAKMVNGQKWLKDSLRADLTVITLKNYKRGMSYQLPVPPSPNLNSQLAIELYPTLCLFEGTTVSQGRGTHFPFTVLGSPYLKGKYDFYFIPQSIPGMKINPLFEGDTCYGLDFRYLSLETIRKKPEINLSLIIDLYQNFDHKNLFFDKSIHKEIGDFNKLAGSKSLMDQIKQGVSIETIRASWAQGLKDYKAMCKQYYLYE